MLGIHLHQLTDFGREQTEIAKTALGAHTRIPWEYHENVFSLIEALKKEEVKIVSVEQHARSKDYKTYHSKEDTALIFGNEVEGVPDSVCKLSDAVIDIPYVWRKRIIKCISVSWDCVI